MTSCLDIFDKINSGDKEAKENFAKENFGLVHMAAKRFAGRGAEYEDLFQIGCVGLIKAIEKFKPETGFAFSTYAVPLIFGELKRFFRDTGAIKVSRKIRENAIKIAAVTARLQVELQREPTISELSAASELSEEDIALALSASRPVLSLSSPTEDGEAELLKIVGADSSGEICERISLKIAITKLERREKDVLVLRYFKGKTQQETAEKLCVSQVQISRIEKKIKEKLKKYLE